MLPKISPALIAAVLVALPLARAMADEPAPDPLTTLVCRDREDPRVGATLVFDLARKRLIESSGTGGTILFDDRDVPVHVGAAAVEWEVAHNTYALNRATLELNVIGRVFLCQIVKNQL